MRGQLQRMWQGEEGAHVLAPQFVAIRAIPRTHERGAAKGARSGTLLAMRKPQRMTQLMAHAANEDAVILPQRDTTILPVLQMLVANRQQIGIQQR